MSDRDDLRDDPAAEADYLARVERQFGLRRGGRVVLSPRDWKLVQEWQSRGIPAEVVLRGINRAFDLFQLGGPRRQSINSLAYCRQHVEAALATWTEQQAASGGPRAAAGLTAAERHLLQAASACEGATGGPLAEALLHAAAELRQLAARAAASDGSVMDIDAQAGAAERHLAKRAAALGTPLPPLPRFSPWQV